MGYSHTIHTGTFYLHKKNVRMKSVPGLTTVYYFRDKIEEGHCNMPSGKKVVVNERTGRLFLKSIY